MNRRVWPWLLVLSIAVAACGDSASDDDAGGASTDVTVAPTETIAHFETTVSGRALPLFESVDSDTAPGAEAPMATGSDLLTGETVELVTAGRPLAIGFFAHWCPHCQREVDELTAWLETNDLPDSVDFVGVSTFEDSQRENHPPAEWFANEGWNHPVIGDTADIAVAQAFGVSSVPFWVLVNADGTVAARLSGNVGPAALADILSALAAG